jgi:hypothetical protein
MTTGLHPQAALTIGITPGAVVPSFAPTLASLPVSFTPGTAEAFPDITVVEGGDQWPLEVADAIRSGSRGVVVSNPGVTTVADVNAAADLANKHGARVVLAEAFAGDPGLLEHLIDVTNHLAAVDTLSIKYVSADGDAHSQLLSALRTARTVGYAGIKLHSVVITDHGFTAAGTAANDAVFAALGVRSSAAVAGQSIRGYGFARTVEIDLFGAKTAAPARISVTNVDGELLVPTVYETADRAAWQRLKRELAEPAAGQTELRDFAADLETVLTA